MIRKFLSFCFVVLVAFLSICVCSCSDEHDEFVCTEKTTQCPGPCEEEMFLGPHGLCTQECRVSSDCPHYEEYGEACLVGICGFVCFDEEDCAFSEYSCIDSLAVCGIE